MMTEHSCLENSLSQRQGLHYIFHILIYLLTQQILIEHQLCAKRWHKVEQDRQISYSMGLTIELERGTNIQIKKNMPLNNKYMMKIKQVGVIKNDGASSGIAMVSGAEWK